MRATILLALLGTLALAAASPRAQDERVLQERARRDLLTQKTFLLVERHRLNAIAFEERLDLVGAEAELLKARELDPANAVILDYLAQVQSLLGKPEAVARSLRVSATERAAAHQQQMKVMAQQDLVSAEQALAAGDSVQAEILARGVVQRIEWSRDHIDWSDLAPRATALLARAEALSGAAGAELRRQREKDAYAQLKAEDLRLAQQASGRIDALLDAGYAAYDRHDFVQAGELATAVLRDEPGNSFAADLRDAARDAGRDSSRRQYLERRREEMLRWRESMEAVRIPNQDIFTPPDRSEWARLTALRTSATALGFDAADPEVLAITAQLSEKRMDAEFEELTLSQVANTIFVTTGIPVSVDPEVSRELDDAAQYVNLSGLRDLPVSSLLNILVEQTGEANAWTIRNGRVYITKAEKAAGAPLVRVHNIQDLTFPITDFKGVKISEIPLPGESGDDPETTVFNSELARVRLIEPDEVLNLVRENIARETWENPAYKIDFVDSQNLLVIHTPDVQAQVGNFLNDLRSFSTSMVTIESRFFALTDAFLEEIGTDLRGLGPSGQSGTTAVLDDVTNENTQGLDNNGDGTGNPAAGLLFQDGDQSYAGVSEHFFDNPLGKLLSNVGGGAFQFTILDDTQVNIVLTAIQKSRNAFEISAPIVSVYNTQRSFVTVVNQVSFVQGYDVDVANGAFIADPNIGVVQEGIVLDVRPTISFDRRYVTLDVQATVASLVRPMQTFSTKLGGSSNEVSFSLPRLDVQDAQTTVVVPDGGSVVLAGFKHVLYRNRTAEAPWFADIPVVGFFFREKGLADEMTDLIIVMKATISDYGELARTPVADATR
ncbi:MAG: hypothetical protein ACT4PU_13340 [Planctomycetota bacterium]